MLCVRALRVCVTVVRGVPLGRTQARGEHGPWDQSYSVFSQFGPIVGLLPSDAPRLVTEKEEAKSFRDITRFHTDMARRWKPRSTTQPPYLSVCPRRVHPCPWRERFIATFSDGIACQGFLASICFCFPLLQPDLVPVRYVLIVPLPYCFPLLPAYPCVCKPRVSLHAPPPQVPSTGFSRRS